MIHKEYSNNEVYIFMNGTLLLKHWLDQSDTAVFCHLWGSQRISFNRDRVQEHDVVEFINNTNNTKAGLVATVVHIYANADYVEVEFNNETMTVRRDQIRLKRC